MNIVVKYKMFAYRNESKFENRSRFSVSLIGDTLIEINPNISQLRNCQSLAKHDYHLLLNFVPASLNTELCSWKEARANILMHEY